MIKDVERQVEERNRVFEEEELEVRTEKIELLRGNAQILFSTNQQPTHYNLNQVFYIIRPD